MFERGSDLLVFAAQSLYHFLGPFVQRTIVAAGIRSRRRGRQSFWLWQIFQTPNLGILVKAGQSGGMADGEVSQKFAFDDLDDRDEARDVCCDVFGGSFLTWFLLLCGGLSVGVLCGGVWLVSLFPSVWGK